MTSLYDELEVSPNATKEEIKKAYKEKVKSNHPDKGGDPEKFKRIVKAYMILYDDLSRARYNRTGEEEKPNELKRDLNKVAETFLTQMTFQTIDELGENLTNKNLKSKLLATLADVRKDLYERLKRQKETYKATLKKKKACIDRINTLKSATSKNLLIELLQKKVNSIDVGEILPIKEELYKLISDLRATLRVKWLLERKCEDFTVEPNINPMEQWDRQMSFDRWGTATRSTGTWF